MQRLDLKSLRYDKLGRSVLIDGRKVTVEISHEALEALFNRELTADEAVAFHHSSLWPLKGIWKRD